MPVSILKNKGQITIPASIRRQLHAEKGDMFDFQLQQDGKVLMTRKQVAPVKIQETKGRKDLSQWIGSKPGIFKTAEEVDQFIRNQRDLWS